MNGAIVIIQANGHTTIRTLDRTPDLDDLQAAVGGSIQLVPLFERYYGKPCAVFCDEEGKLKGLPVNVRATREWYRAMGVTSADDVLCGAVAIVTGDRALLEAL